MKVYGGAFVLVMIAVLGAAAQTPPSLSADRNFQAGVGEITDLAFSPDGRLIAVVGESGGVAVWDAQAATSIRPATRSGPSTVRVAFGANGNFVAFGDEDGTVSTLDLRSGQVTVTAKHSESITSLSLSPDGQLGASGDENGELRVWPTTGASGTGERLRDDGRRRESIVFLGFSSPTTLVAVTKDLRIVEWDTSAKKTLRNSTFQIESIGRQGEFLAAGADAGATVVAVAAKYLAAESQGALTGPEGKPQTVEEVRTLGGGLRGVGGVARPRDLARTNVIVPYTSATGRTGDHISLGDFQPEHLSVSPGSCYGVFSSNYQNQPRAHVWKMEKQGQDPVRLDLPARASAIRLDAAGRLVAVGFGSGEVRTWRASGVTESDCSTLKNTAKPVQSSCSFEAGSEATPLFPPGTGFRVAVLSFEVGGAEAFLGDFVSQRVSGELANSPSVMVVERAAIDAIVKEMQLQRSGLTTNDAVRVGRGLNVQKVILGRVDRLGGTTFALGARVVDVETQQVQGSREVTGYNCSEAQVPQGVAALKRLIVP